MQLSRVYDGTRTRNIPDHNRARCLHASYTVRSEGFEPTHLVLPKHAPFQAWLTPVDHLVCSSHRAPEVLPTGPE